MRLHRKKIFLGSCSTFLVLLGSIILWTISHPMKGAVQMTALNKDLGTSISSTGITPPSANTPKRMLVVPKLNLRIPVEQVGLTKKGAMDVPIHDNAAGLYKLGPEPGQAGSAVIDGHNTIANKGLGIFGKMNQLIVGDMISYQTEGQIIQFTVTRIAEYPVANVPLKDVFGNHSGQNLNLITCAGHWSRAAKAYPNRLVIYTKRNL